MLRLTYGQEKQLIDYFKEHASLWNTKHRDYNNRAIRAQKLDLIANQLHLNRKDVYEKYRNLRTTFFREHKRVTRMSDDGTSAYESRWRHYNNMLFLAKAHSWLGPEGRDPFGAPCSGGQRPSSSNDDSSSLHNGHDIEFKVEEDGVPVVPPLTAAALASMGTLPSSDDLILMTASQNGSATTAVRNNDSVSPGAGTTIHHHQRVHSGNSNSSGTSTSSTISSKPVTGLSVIHAPASNHGSGKGQVATTTNPTIINVVPAHSCAKVEPLSPPLQGATAPRPIITTTAAVGTASTFLINSPIAFMPSFVANHTSTVNHGSSPAFALAAQRPATPSLNPIHSGPGVSSASGEPSPQQATARKSSSFYVVTAAPSTMKPSSFEPIQPQLPAATTVTDVRQPKSPTFIVTNGGGGPAAASTPVKSGGAGNKVTKVLDYGEMREVIKSVVSETIVEYEDEEMAFCRSLAASLRTLMRSDKDAAKLELQQVIVRYTNPGYSAAAAGGTVPAATQPAAPPPALSTGNGQPPASAVATVDQNTAVVLLNYSPPASNAVSTIMTTGSGGVRAGTVAATVAATTVKSENDLQDSGGGGGHH